jgi:acetylornithine deacetylase
MAASVDINYLITTLKDLVRINSVNPNLSGNGPGEEEIGQYIADHLKKLNITTEIDVLGEGRMNVTGIIEGAGSGRSIMLNAHMDTVDVLHMKEPFSAKIEGGKLYGRGAQDMKASIAAILAMAKKIHDNNIRLDGDIILSFVADEEYNSIGTEYALKKYHTDGAIVTEPTDLNVCIAHKGFGLFELITHGRAAHGGLPDEGIDANMRMAAVMQELSLMADQLKESRLHPLLGRPSFHIPLIKGGSAPFTYADQCKLILERRTMPHERETDVLLSLNAINEKLLKRQISADVSTLMWRDAFEADKQGQMVTSLCDAYMTITGRNPEFIGHSWWEESALISEKGIDTVVFGPKGHGLHSAVEWVDIQSVITMADILYRTVTHYCTKTKE